ncbi:hypothetical protein AIIKEEIJ_06199 [Rhodococcus sp. YH1]|nr:hypothetical protein [Rhodococcus sp. YH1]NCL78691.1 hypothetical protein [Rhodococcus sp. YH1]
MVDNSLQSSTANVAAFWAKVVKSPTYWYWVGAIGAPGGYGLFNFQRANRQRTLLVHRFSVELMHGPLEPNVVCEHKCNAPWCVRAGHDHHVQCTQRERALRDRPRKAVSGHSLLDQQRRSRYERSLAIGDALRGRYGQEAYEKEALLCAETDPGDGQGTSLRRPVASAGRSRSMVHWWSWRPQTMPAGAPNS